MRRVRGRPFREYFRTPQSETEAGSGLVVPGWIGWYYRRRNFFHPFVFAAALIVCGTILSFQYRAAQVLTLTLFLLLSALYLQIRNVAQGLYIQRRLPARAYEKKPLPVIYEVRNTSRFSVYDTLIRDRFSGSLMPERSVGIDREIPAISLQRAEARYFCDGGMGPHHLGPLTVIVSDPLGIFEFSITEDRLEGIEVVPEHISVEHFPIPQSTESAISGTHEGKALGQSTNFFGVREYRAGDPIRRIHWKLSAKHRELVVKEFENVVNTDLTICLDLDQRNHIGFKSSSTWEYCKDIAVSLIRERGLEVGRIQFLSQSLSIPFGTGREHLEAMVQKVSCLRPLNVSNKPHLLEEAWLTSPYGSGLLYITPVYQNDSRQIASFLESLTEKAIRVGCVYVPAGPFTESLPAYPEVQGRISEKNQESEQILESLLKLNAGLKITTHVVERGKAISQSLILPRIEA